MKPINDSMEFVNGKSFLSFDLATSKYPRIANSKLQRSNRAR